MKLAQGEMIASATERMMHGRIKDSGVATAKERSINVVLGTPIVEDTVCRWPIRTKLY